MKFREVDLESGTKLLLGKNSKQNEELVNQFKGKNNVILHTANPGSPFCIVWSLRPTRQDLKLSGSWCASYSQDWRDNKTDVKVHQFTGKDVYKRKGMKEGTFGVKKYKLIKISKKDIEKLKNKSSNDTKSGDFA